MQIFAAMGETLVDKLCNIGTMNLIYASVVIRVVNDIRAEYAECLLELLLVLAQITAPAKEIRAKVKEVLLHLSEK